MVTPFPMLLPWQQLRGWGPLSYGEMEFYF